MNEKVLNEITNYCEEECISRENCPEEECILYRIEKIVEPELKEFEIEVTEILQRVVKVKATNKDEALKIVHRRYKDEEIVLDYEDCVSNHIRVR